MKGKITPVRAFIIAVSAIAIALVMMILFAYFYQKQRVSRYQSLSDTRDLKQKIEALGREYVKGHPHASLTIAISTRSNFFFQGFTVSGTNPPTRDTIYEIGSITKLFTAILLARLEADGVLAATNTVAQVLPASIPLAPGVGNITLGQLVTHTAGFPRLPENLLKLAKDPQNPYRDYDTNELYQALATVKLGSEPGKKLQYSNFGYGLLGHLIELKTGKHYNDLIMEHITRPLGLESTWMNVPAEHTARLLPGHDSKGQVVPFWDFRIMGPAGGLKSSAEDMIQFSRANLDANLPLHSILATTHKVRFRGLGGVVGWGWHSARTLEELTFLWHNGGTGGFVSFLGLDPESGNSVVVLSNSGDAMDMDGSVDKMGMEILKLATKISLE